MHSTFLNGMNTQEDGGMHLAGSDNLHEGGVIYVCTKVKPVFLCPLFSLKLI